MKCKICKAPAAVALKSHNAAFCPDCYKDFFARQVARGIEGQKLFTRDERILVALSGGKDSLALMLELARQDYNVTGLHIDLAIPGSSAAARGVVERFCAKHGLKLLIKDMAAEGLPIPAVKERLHRPICSACGKIKRHFFNKVALDEGFDALATGHNLDDEAARLFSNTLRSDTGGAAGRVALPALPLGSFCSPSAVLFCPPGTRAYGVPPFGPPPARAGAGGVNPPCPQGPEYLIRMTSP